VNQHYIIKMTTVYCAKGHNEQKQIHNTRAYALRNTIECSWWLCSYRIVEPSWHFWQFHS